MTAPSPAGLYVVEEDITSLPEHVVAPDTTKYLVNLGFDTDNTDLYSDQADASNVIVNTSNYGKLALNKVSSTNSIFMLKMTRLDMIIVKIHQFQLSRQMVIKMLY